MPQEMRSTPRAIIKSALEAIDLFVRTENPVEHPYSGLQDDIARFTSNLLNGRATGSFF